MYKIAHKLVHPEDFHKIQFFSEQKVSGFYYFY